MMISAMLVIIMDINQNVVDVLEAVWDCEVKDYI